MRSGRGSKGTLRQRARARRWAHGGSASSRGARPRAAPGPRATRARARLCGAVVRSLGRGAPDGEHAPRGSWGAYRTGLAAARSERAAAALAWERVCGGLARLRAARRGARRAAAAVQAARAAAAVAGALLRWRLGAVGAARAREGAEAAMRKAGGGAVLGGGAGGEAGTRASAAAAVAGLAFEGAEGWADESLNPAPGSAAGPLNVFVTAFSDGGGGAGGAGVR